jgi:hypothetical protein
MGGKMLVYKVLSAVAAAALGAAVVMVLPGFSPNVAASASTSVAKSDRLDYRPLGTDCSEQTWPYFQGQCLRSRAAGQPRPVRLVTADRRPS